MPPKPTKRELGPIMAGAGIFIVSMYATIHGFLYPRSEAEASNSFINKRLDYNRERLDKIEGTLDRDRRDCQEGIKTITQYVMEHKK